VQHGQHAKPLVGPTARARECCVLVRKVEARGQLVEQQEGPARWIGVALDQHAGELHALALAARQHGVGTVGEGERLGLTVGTGWPGVMTGVVVLPGHCAAGGGGLVLPVALGVAGVGGVWATAGRANAPPIAVLASST